MQIINYTLYTLLLLMFSIGCHDSIDVGSDCMQDRINDFKKEDHAQLILRIERPEGALYWFVNTHVDTGEQVLSEDCQVFCITDLEGISQILCDGSIFSFPRTIIWEK